MAVLFEGVELWLQQCLLHNVTENITKKKGQKLDRKIIQDVGMACQKVHKQGMI